MSIATPLNLSPTPVSARDAAFKLLEGIVFRPWFSLALAGMLYVFLLPFFAISLVIAAIGSTAVAVVPPFRRHRRSIDSDVRKAWTANEFGFERAIEAYEELIDAHAWRRQ